VTQLHECSRCRAVKSQLKKRRSELNYSKRYLLHGKEPTGSPTCKTVYYHCNCIVGLVESLMVIMVVSMES